MMIGHLRYRKNDACMFSKSKMSREWRMETTQPSKLELIEIGVLCRWAWIISDR